MSDAAVINCPVVWEDACIKSAPISAWYPINPNKIPTKSFTSPLFINLLVWHLYGLALLAIDLPVLTINQLCQRLKSSKIKEIVVNDSPGVRPSCPSLLFTTFEKSKTDATTTLSMDWIQKRIQPIRFIPNESDWKSILSDIDFFE